MTAGFVASLLIAAPASAHYFGNVKADSRVHLYVSIESNQTDKNYFQPMVTDVMKHIENVTVIDTAPDSYDAQTDVYWYATDQDRLGARWYAAQTDCVAFRSAGVCEQFRIMFNEDMYRGRTDRENHHTVCHEVTHTLGSDDGMSPAGGGCFPQSAEPYDKRLNAHEIGHINDYYR